MWMPSIPSFKFECPLCIHVYRWTFNHSLHSPWNNLSNHSHWYDRSWQPKKGHSPPLVFPNSFRSLTIIIIDKKYREKILKRGPQKYRAILNVRHLGNVSHVMPCLIYIYLDQHYTQLITWSTSSSCLVHPSLWHLAGLECMEVYWIYHACTVYNIVCHVHCQNYIRYK